MINDFKYALRRLIKAPGFTVIAILTLALGIGANSAIFSVVEGALLRPLPFPHSERLVRIYEALDENGTRSASLNLSDRTASRLKEFGRDVFEDVGAGTGGVAVVGLNDASPAQTLPAARITSNFFTVLGLSPSKGRNFNADEVRDKAPVVIISDDFWRQTMSRRLTITIYMEWVAFGPASPPLEPKRSCGEYSQRLIATIPIRPTREPPTFRLCARASSWICGRRL